MIGRNNDSAPNGILTATFCCHSYSTSSFLKKSSGSTQTISLLGCPSIRQQQCPVVHHRHKCDSFPQQSLQSMLASCSTHSHKLISTQVTQSESCKQSGVTSPLCCLPVLPDRTALLSASVIRQAAWFKYLFIVQRDIL